MAAQIRIGVVGVRNNGRSHCKRLLALGRSDVKLAALADTDAERTADAARKMGVEKTYSEAADLFADPEIDAVILSLPNFLHAPFSIQAMRAGKDVLVEKPISMNVKEAEEMIRVRDETGRTLMVGMNQRFSPVVYQVRQAIADGVIGNVQYVRTRWLRCRPFEGLWGRGDWFLTPGKSGGGPMIDLGVHKLDLALHLIGFPNVKAVLGNAFHGIGCEVGRLRNRPYEIEDSAVGFVNFENGSSLLVEASYCMNVSEEGQQTEIFGDRGRVLMTEGAEAVIETFDHEGTSTPIELAPAENACTSCVEHFASVLTGAQELVPTAEQALVSMKILEQIYAGSNVLQKQQPVNA